MKRPPIKTKHIEIIDYWCGRIYEGDMGVDWSDTICTSEKCINDFLEEQGLSWDDLKKLKIPRGAEYRCWRCADLLPKGKVQRCHIKANQFDGADEPSNLVLLCQHCHEEAPDLRSDKEAIWDWIKATSKGVYGEFWSDKKNQEFEKMYGRKPFTGNSKAAEELKGLKDLKEKFEFVASWNENLHEECLEEVGIHAFPSGRNWVSPSSCAIMMKKLGA